MFVVESMYPGRYRVETDIADRKRVDGAGNPQPFEFQLEPGELEGRRRTRASRPGPASSAASWSTAGIVRWRTRRCWRRVMKVAPTST